MISVGRNPTRIALHDVASTAKPSPFPATFICSPSASVLWSLLTLFWILNAPCGSLNFRSRCVNDNQFDTPHKAFLTLSPLSSRPNDYFSGKHSINFYWALNFIVEKHSADRTCFSKGFKRGEFIKSAFDGKTANWRKHQNRKNVLNTINFTLSRLNGTEWEKRDLWNVLESLLA